jgi:hypoxanthine phosphoribosyltransferase
MSRTGMDEIDDTRTTTLAFCVKELRKMDSVSIGIIVLHNKKKDKRMCAHWRVIMEDFNHEGLK